MKFVYQLATIALVVFGIQITGHAQATNSNDPFELFVGKGTWGVMLPSYSSGVAADGGTAFQDDLDSPGFIAELRTVRRFLDTRTSFETRAFYGVANANSISSRGDIAFQNPANGAVETLTGGISHLSSDVDHYGFDLALRDTWRTRFGGLSAGAAFSYMAFDQQFEVGYAGNRLFEETLDSDFTGGKGFVGWDGFLMNRAANVDLLFGYYDVDAEYDFDGKSIAGDRRLSDGGQSATVEIRGSTRTIVNIGEIGLTLSAMYIDQMPALRQNAGATTLTTDQAATVSAMVEWIF